MKIKYVIADGTVLFTMVDAPVLPMVGESIRLPDTVSTGFFRVTDVMHFPPENDGEYKVHCYIAKKT